MKIEYWLCEGWRPVVNGLMDRRGYLFLWRARLLGLMIRLGITHVQPFPSVPWFTEADYARFREYKERNRVAITSHDRDAVVSRAKVTGE